MTVFLLQKQVQRRGGAKPKAYPPDVARRWVGGWDTKIIKAALLTKNNSNDLNDNISWAIKGSLCHTQIMTDNCYYVLYNHWTKSYSKHKPN